jgi:hypothetical protein
VGVDDRLRLSILAVYGVRTYGPSQRELEWVIKGQAPYLRPFATQTQWTTAAFAVRRSSGVPGNLPAKDCPENVFCEISSSRRKRATSNLELRENAQVQRKTLDFPSLFLCPVTTGSAENGLVDATGVTPRRPKKKDGCCLVAGDRSSTTDIFRR